MRERGLSRNRPIAKVGRSRGWSWRGVGEEAQATTQQVQVAWLERALIKP